MVGSNYVETKQDENYWDEGIESLSLNCRLVCDFGLCTLLFYVIKELPEESGGIYIYLCSLTSGITGTCLCRQLIFHYECYFDDPILLYYGHYRKKLFVKFCQIITINFHYKVQVYNMIFVVVHDNHYRQWMLHKNTNSVLDYFH